MKRLNEIISNYHHSTKDCVIPLFPNFSTKEPIDYHNLKFDIIVPLDHTIELTCYSNEHLLDVGDILISCPHIVNLLPGSHTKCLIIQIPLSLLYVKPLESYISSLAPIKLIEKNENPELHESILQYITDIMEEYYSISSKKELVFYMKLIQLINSLIEETKDQKVTALYNITEAKQKEYADKFMQICEYINEHYSSVITLEEVADLAGFSKYHFSRLFKQFTGETFYQYLNNKRMMTAEILLQNSQLTITDVALLSGFPNISSFIRMFKLHNKCTPSEFRVSVLKKA